MWTELHPRETQSSHLLFSHAVKKKKKRTMAHGSKTRTGQGIVQRDLRFATCLMVFFLLPFSSLLCVCMYSLLRLDKRQRLGIGTTEIESQLVSHRLLKSDSGRQGG